MSPRRRWFDPPPVGVRRPVTYPSRRAEQQALAQRLRAQGFTWAQAAVVLMERYRLSAMVAMREVHGWSQAQAAQQWCLRWPEKPRTDKQISYWETWRNRAGHGPSLWVLDRLAQLYECRVADLLMDLGDYGPRRPDGQSSREEKVTQIDELAVRDSFARADTLEAEVLSRWPHAWQAMDRLRRQPPGRWPNWCLLPASAAQMVIGESAGRPAPAAAVLALYAWRFARSIYTFEPGLAARLMKAGLDEIDGVEPFIHLPEWCVYVAAGEAGWPGAGLWAYLNHDAGLGRAELCLLLDLNRGGLDTLIYVPVYLDRDSLTQALAEMRANLKAKTRGRHNAAVKRWTLDDSVASLADAIDKLAALIAYLSQPTADLLAADGTNARPTRGLRPVEQQRVWAVGWTGHR